MKKVMALILCLCVMLCCGTACKPDNITAPATIVDPAPPEETVQPAGQDDPPGTPAVAPENPGENEEESGAKLPAETANPLARAAFEPAQTVEPLLPASGLVKTAATALKNQTISLITADETPAFSYTDESGKAVNEWEWLSALAEARGAQLKYKVKNASVSVKAQRIALFSGQALSLVQLAVQDLASGLALTASATPQLDTERVSFGVSKAVLNLSDGRLFAPAGLVNSFWYDESVLTGDLAPAALAETGGWTLSAYKDVYADAARRMIMPVALEEKLAWATLSGRSPLTLLNGKLDSNINARVTRAVWAVMQNLHKELPAFVHDEDFSYTLKEGTLALEYTALPEAAEGQKLRWAGLPSVEQNGENPVTFTGAFFALPKFGLTEEQQSAALLLAELWCNRYAETRAAALKALGIAGNDYQAYIDYAETHGYLILHSIVLEDAAADYIKEGLEGTAEMDPLYRGALETTVNAYLAAQNVQY